MNAASETAATRAIALGALLVAAGGLLLGLQLDANGALAGTGFAPLGIGALLALGAVLARAGTATRVPRDLLAACAAAGSFAALAFVLAGVLVPGGPWMFFQVAVLLALVAFRPLGADPVRVVGKGTLVLLALFLLFRLWISYQGSEHRWQVLSLGVPVLSWLPFDFLEPVKRVSLGSFTPFEMGFPPAGLAFGATCALWSLGFAACVAGLLLVQHGAREHESDGVHALIHTLPPALAQAVERLVPEDEWEALGLHGLPERRLARRIERLVGERMLRQQEVRSVLEAGRLLQPGGGSGFAGGISRALLEPGGSDAPGAADGPRASRLPPAPGASDASNEERNR